MYRKWAHVWVRLQVLTILWFKWGKHNTELPCLKYSHKSIDHTQTIEILLHVVVWSRRLWAFAICGCIATVGHTFALCYRTCGEHREEGLYEVLHSCQLFGHIWGWEDVHDDVSCAIVKVLRIINWYNRLFQRLHITFQQFRRYRCSVILRKQR